VAETLVEIDVGGDAGVLSLVDQLYDTRQKLLSLTAAVKAQDKSVQAAILAAMGPDDGSPAAADSQVRAAISSFRYPAAGPA